VPTAAGMADHGRPPMPPVPPHRPPVRTDETAGDGTDRRRLETEGKTMIRTLLTLTVLVAGITTILWVGGACEEPILPNRAFAQPGQGSRTAHEIDAGLFLARLVVHEGGSRELDHEAIHQTLRNMGGNRLDFSRGPLRRIQFEEEGRWPRRLNRELTRPLGWPEDRLPWDSARGRGLWQQVLAWADERVGQESGWPRPCSGVPITWGRRCELYGDGVCDQDRPHYRRVDCGDTANYFAERAERR
jgi:hypothetical protein